MVVLRGALDEAAVATICRVRDRLLENPGRLAERHGAGFIDDQMPVSYTHLTLPTKA